MKRFPALVSLMAVANLVVSVAPPSHAQTPPAVPVGFAVSPYAAVGGLTTSLAFGPDTRNLSRARLYVARFSDGQVVAIDDTNGVGGAPSTFATGFRNPLGVLVASDGTVYVSDAEAARAGPFGTRQYGRVWRVRDTNADGDATDAGDLKEVVLKDLPNGRHNTNGMAFGPDGMLYVTNGNSTDDGIDGGEPEAKPWSGSVIKIDPQATGVSLTSLAPVTSLVAHGMRNDFDISFSPVDGTKLFITTNGADDARENQTGGEGQLEDSDDLLYLTDVDDRRRTSRPTSSFVPKIDDFRFPSCLYNRTRRGNLEPYDSPNPQVIAAFGACPKTTVPRPVATFDLHVSADGLEFQRTNAWGADFRNDLFVAEFGNFFGDEVVGHKVVRVELDATGTTVTAQSDFLSGGAPLDVTFDAAGNFYVADFSGQILKVVKVA
jgi:glucose/arabinose dehydrogenase